MNLYRTIRGLFARLTPQPVVLTPGVRNFLLRVEAEGGFLFESDPLLEEWAEESHEANRLGLFVSEGGFGVGSRLTSKAERALSKFRETGAIALASHDKGYSGAPGGLVLARKSEPDA